MQTHTLAHSIYTILYGVYAGILGIQDAQLSYSILGYRNLRISLFQRISTILQKSVIQDLRFSECDPFLDIVNLGHPGAYAMYHVLLQTYSRYICEHMYLLCAQQMYIQCPASSTTTGCHHRDTCYGRQLSHIANHQSTLYNLACPCHHDGTQDLSCRQLCSRAYDHVCSYALVC